MNVILNTTLWFIAFSFVASVATGVIKLLFFLRKKDSYRHILKYGLIGILAGGLIAMGLYFFNVPQLTNDEESGPFLIIPLYTMLAGLLAGSIIVWQQKAKRTSKFSNH